MSSSRPCSKAREGVGRLWARRAAHAFRKALAAGGGNGVCVEVSCEQHHQGRRVFNGGLDTWRSTAHTLDSCAVTFVRQKHSRHACMTG